MSQKTLTLQLVFDPSNDTYTGVGRFLPDPGDTYPQTPLSQRSKIWILDRADGTQSVVPDSDGYAVKAQADAPLVRIHVLMNKNSGNLVDWDGYALRMTAVFGRAHHAENSDNDFASPFVLKGSHPAVVAASFGIEVDAATAQQQGALLELGAPHFYDPHSPALYEFNIGVVAHIQFPNNPNTVTYTYGHDPDMEVGQ